MSSGRGGDGGVVGGSDSGDNNERGEISAKSRCLTPGSLHGYLRVNGYKDFCGSTALGTPESVGMNGQIDWQAQQISHLVCSLSGQRCSEA